METYFCVHGQSHIYKIQGLQILILKKRDLTKVTQRTSHISVVLRIPLSSYYVFHYPEIRYSILLHTAPCYWRQETYV